jgi:hypothetical protein
MLQHIKALTCQDKMYTGDLAGDLAGRCLHSTAWNNVNNSVTKYTEVMPIFYFKYSCQQSRDSPGFNSAVGCLSWKFRSISSTADCFNKQNLTLSHLFGQLNGVCGLVTYKADHWHSVTRLTLTRGPINGFT